MLFRPSVVVAGCVAMCVVFAPSVSAQPEPPLPPPPPPAEPVAADVGPEVGPAVPDGVIAPDGATPPVGVDPAAPVHLMHVESAPPATITTPDGWEMTLGAQDETRTPVRALTTASSSREYLVNATYTASITGPAGETPEGVIEAGYEIGCGIDVALPGVQISGNAGIGSSTGLAAGDFFNVGGAPIPVVGATAGIAPSLGGGVTTTLIPGAINIVPVTQKSFTGAEPWVMVRDFRVRADNCVGESFIRSYAYLTNTTSMTQDVLGWYGITTQI